VLAVGVAADVVAAVEDEHPQSQFRRAAFGDGESEEAGTHHHKINVHGSSSCDAPVASWARSASTPRSQTRSGRDRVRISAGSTMLPGQHTDTVIAVGEL